MPGQEGLVAVFRPGTISRTSMVIPLEFVPDQSDAMVL